MKTTEVTIHVQSELSGNRLEWWFFLPRSRAKVECNNSVSRGWFESQINLLFYRHFKHLTPVFPDPRDY